MSKAGARVQPFLIGGLFVLSLGILLWHGGQVLLLPRREQALRDRLSRCAADLSLAGAAQGRFGTGQAWELAHLTTRVLAGEPGVEGGFYLGDRDHFLGFANPSQGLPTAEGPPRRDPPPLEMPDIRLQCRRTLDNNSPEVRVTDIGPSRVAIATAVVSSPAPGGTACWVMARVTGPAELAAQARRFQTSALLGLGGIFLALVLTFHLQRNLRRARAEQEQLAGQLRQAEQLAWLGRLLAGVAHEVRNPLAGIRSTVQLWQRLPETARSPAALEAVVHAVDRLEGLVGRLLFFARSGHEGARPVDLNTLVGEAFDLLRAQAGEQQVELVADLDEGLHAVSGAAGALGQVVLNLLVNALQAVPAGGRVTCRTRRSAAAVELTVSDTGPGVPPDARAHLFEPFFTTRPEGTGLGLALCREIVQQHGGRIDLMADAPGATFRVVLPADPGTTP